MPINAVIKSAEAGMQTFLQGTANEGKDYRQQVYMALHSGHTRKVQQIHTLASKVKVASCIESISVKSESSVP